LLRSCQMGPGSLILWINSLHPFRGESCRDAVRIRPRRYCTKECYMQALDTTKRIVLHYLFAAAVLTIYGGQV